jgi:hypothetical protein
MNEYGRMAREHWKRWLPQRYSQIEDPNSFFSTLGEQVSTRIADLTLDLAGEDPPGETFMDKLGRHNNARQRAREMVLPETVLLDPEPGVDTEDDPRPDQSQTDQSQTDWVPMREDPSHPWWQQAIADEETRLS